MGRSLDDLRVKLAPRIRVNKKIYESISLFSTLLRERTDTPKVLIVGSGPRMGRGLDRLGKRLLDNSVNLDLFAYPTVDLVADAHHLPIQSEAFDGVIVQDVLEHVEKPAQVVAEIYRVLRGGGMVLSMTPLIQVFHAVPSDYQRYTIPGMRVLFADFTEIRSGVAVGPSNALVHILSYYLAILLSFNSTLLFRGLLLSFAWLLSPLILLDRFLLDNPKSHLMARELFFLGEKQSNSVFKELMPIFASSADCKETSLNVEGRWNRLSSNISPQ